MDRESICGRMRIGLNLLKLPAALLIACLAPAYFLRMREAHSLESRY
jgi:hypothetical protein